MTSKKTIYRQKRYDLIQECIMELCQLLTLKKFEIEAIPLVFLKKLRKAIKDRRFS